MESDLRSIGELARDSGLSVSALRFYDGAEVLAPARVDPRTGYRWYAPEQLADARLLARLRRVGLPLAEIRAVLGAVPGSGAAQRLMDEHLRRLEDGLVDARRELSSIRRLIDQRENPMSTTPAEYRFTVPARQLARALDAVRFAVGGDPELPVLSGVLFDLDGGLLRLVATDRYRIALAEVPVESVAPVGSASVESVSVESVECVPPVGRAVPAASAVVPVALADAVRALLGPAEGRWSWHSAPERCTSRWAATGSRVPRSTTTTPTTGPWSGWSRCTGSACPPPSSARPSCPPRPAVCRPDRTARPARSPC